MHGKTTIKNIVGITDIQYTWRTTCDGSGVTAISEGILKSEIYVKGPVTRKNSINMDRCSVLLGNTLFASILSGFFTLTFMFNTPDKQLLVRC
jgi:hypothetical protein